MKGKCAVPLAALVCVLTASAAPAQPRAAAPSRYEIQLLEGRFIPPTGLSPDARRALARQGAALAARGEKTIHVLVQLVETPSELEKAALWRDGLDLGAYLPGSAWIAAVPAGRLAALAERPDVRWLTLWDAARKIHPRAKQGDWAPWARDPERPGFVMIALQLHHDVALEEAFKLVDAVGGVLLPPLDGLHGATAWVREEKVAELAGFEQVLWIEEGPPPLTPTNDGVRAYLRVDPVVAPPYSLTGADVRIFVFDGGTVRASHETFRPGAEPTRVVLLDATAVAGHSTHVAGIAAGDGAPSSVGGAGRGIATGATVLSAGYEQILGDLFFWDNAGDVESDYALARNSYNADLGTNSIGSNTASNGYPCSREGDYGVTANLVDGIVRGDNATVGGPVIMSWANGNERGGGPPNFIPGRCGANYMTTSSPSCAKNPIHVGALYSDGGAMTNSSSWGPCDDGRLKPVVSAPGCETGRVVAGATSVYSSIAASDTAYGGACGTSMATPAVAGTVALLIQDWRARGFGGGNARPLPALVKSMLVHSARDLGQEGPDYIYGYGAVDAKALIDQLRAGTGVLGAAGPVVWGTDSVTDAAVDTWFFNVAAGTGELKATLAWDDAAAPAFSANAAVNDLTLELIAPGGTVFRSFILNPASPHLPATTGLNNVDNQEQVLVKFPAAGQWQVRVSGTNVPQGPQTYGLVYSAIEAAYYTAGCTTTSWGYEAGNDGWILTGAARTAAPAPGHGAFSLRLGGAVSTTHEATLDVAIPARLARAEWTFWWHMTTQEGASGFGHDQFIAEVRNATTNAVLSVFDVRFDGWRSGQWMQEQKIDLTPWAGQTVKLVYWAVNDPSLFTTFWVDDGQLITCPLADAWHKDRPGDTGVEPTPGASPMWTSPDLWVRNSNDGGLTHQNPKLGQTNYIYGFIRNRGPVTAQNLPVSLYVANASTGLSWPTQWTFIGTAVVPSVAPGGVATMVVPWSPAGEGHYCLVSRIVSAQDPMTFPEGTDLSVNTRNNNNIVWRNVNIVNLTGPPLLRGDGGLGSITAPAVGKIGPVTVELIVRNFEDKERTLELAFIDRTNERIDHAFRQRGRVRVTVSAELVDSMEEQGVEGGVGLQRVDQRTFEVVENDAYFTLPTMAAGQELTFQMTFEDTLVKPARGDIPSPGAETKDENITTYIFDVVQREPGKDPEGGVTYEIQAPPV